MDGLLRMFCYRCSVVHCVVDVCYGCSAMDFLGLFCYGWFIVDVQLWIFLGCALVVILL